MTRAAETAGIRELFIEELTEIHGGQYKPDCPFCYTTQACCEEGPLDGCCVVILDPGP